MVKLENILQDDSYSSEYLSKYCKVAYTTPADFKQVASLIANKFNIPRMHPSRTADVMQFLYDTKLDIHHSVKLYNPITNKIYGILMLGNRKISEACPLFQINYPLIYSLQGCSQINGIGFLIDKRLRGKGFDKKMISLAKEYIDRFDLVWHGVDNSLHSHDYWKRFGFKQILDTEQAQFYARFLK